MVFLLNERDKHTALCELIPKRTDLGHPEVTQKLVHLEDIRERGLSIIIGRLVLH